MFSFFRRKRKYKLPIAKGLKEIERTGALSFGAVIMIKEQVLFQIIQSKYLMQHGFTPEDENGFSEVHFFNKSKTNTISIHEKFKGDLADDYFYFEEPSNNHNYVREMGSDYEIIENRALDRIRIIYEADPSTLTLQIQGS